MGAALLGCDLIGCEASLGAWALPTSELLHGIAPSSFSSPFIESPLRPSGKAAMGWLTRRSLTLPMSYCAMGYTACADGKAYWLLRVATLRQTLWRCAWLPGPLYRAMWCYSTVTLVQRQSQGRIIIIIITGA